jgi:two-component system, cell cycle sensor histidine kinase and response regulator CckA
MDEAARNTEGSGTTILLADDDNGVRSLLATTLRSRGYEVIEASGGLPALELFGEHHTRIRLLITDVVMPDLRGPALATKVRQLQPRLPVLFITGYTDRNDIHADDLLMHKPFTPNALATAVKDILS